MNHKKKAASYRAAKREAARMKHAVQQVSRALEDTKKTLSDTTRAAQKIRAEAEDMRRYGVPVDVSGGLLLEVQRAMATEVGRRLADQVLQQMGSEADVRRFIIDTARKVADYYAGGGTFSPIGSDPVIEFTVQRAMERQELRANMILSGNYSHIIDARQARLYRG